MASVKVTAVPHPNVREFTVVRARALKLSVEFKKISLKDCSTGNLRLVDINFRLNKVPLR
jgi:hypothetical protein